MKFFNRITIGKTRTSLYKSARILGDINAVKRGKMGRRATHRLTGLLSARILSKLVKNISKIF